MSWRIRDLVVEGLRNLAGSPARSTMLAVAAGAVIGALVFVELSTTEDLLAFEQRFVDSGGNVVVAFSEQGISTGRCHSLTAMSGVKASAAIAVGPAVEAGNSPGTLFNSGTVTAGAIGLFAVDSARPVGESVDRWILGSEAAKELGLREGSWLAVGSTRRQVGVVIDTETRNPQIARWILETGAPSGTSQQCWVEFLPGARTGRVETIDTVFAGSSDVVVTPWIRLDDFARNPTEELAARPQIYAWIVAGLILSAIAWIATWFRRSQIGLYRAVGTGPAALLILGTVEYAAPILTGAIAGTLWATAAWTATTDGFAHYDQLVIAYRTAASAAFLATATAALLWPATAKGSIAEQLKDR
jgi:hypothetical protein